MRILMLIEWNPGRGGAEAYAITLRDGLRRAGDQVRLLTSSVGSAADGSADYVAFSTEWLPAQALLQIHNPLAAATVRRAVQEFRPDVVWVNMFAHHLSASIFRALAGTPVVLFVSDYKLICPLGSKLLPDGSLCHHAAGVACLETGCLSLLHWLRDQLRYRAIQGAITQVPFIVVCSEWMRAALLRSGWSSRVLPYPVAQPQRRERRPSPGPTFFYFGRLDREKGVALLLEALARLPDHACLRIAGQGPLRRELEGLARDLGLAARVRFLGWLDQKEIDRELTGAWAVVIPSLWAEPLGMVALEAGVRGVPVIASNAGGLGEVVVEGVSGLLFPNGNVDELVNCLARVTEGAAFPEKKLTEEVIREISKRFETDQNITSWRQVFDAAINHGNSESKHAFLGDQR